MTSFSYILLQYKDSNYPPLALPTSTLTVTLTPGFRHVGFAATFAPYVFAMACTACVYHFYLPETKGKTFESLAFDKKREQRIPLLTASGPGSDTEQEHIRSPVKLFPTADDFEVKISDGKKAVNGNVSNGAFLDSGLVSGQEETDDEL